jgi:PIN domain nuclease of toxin-antitoxin system
MLQGEAGSEVVLRHAAESWISATNMAEVYGKLVLRGVPSEPAIEMAFGSVKGVIAFNDGQARLTAELLHQTKALGLSLGDRACLALGMQRSLPVLTADKAWKTLRVGVEIRVIR